MFLAQSSDGEGSYDFKPNVGKVQTMIGHCIENFGSQRCFWGSDWPVSLHTNDTNLAENISIYKNALEKLNVEKDEIDAIFDTNAKKFYNLELNSNYRFHEKFYNQ